MESGTSTIPGITDILEQPAKARSVGAPVGGGVANPARHQKDFGIRAFVEKGLFHDSQYTITLPMRSARTKEGDRLFGILLDKIAKATGYDFEELLLKKGRWGSITKIRLPGGGDVGLYQPKHPTALGIGLK